MENLPEPETEKDKIERKRFKADTRNLIDATLLGICITFFCLIATLKPVIISKNPVFTIQLVLTIPFFMCCLLARIKEATYPDPKRWYKLGYVCFTLAYGFFINSIALLISFIAPMYIALTFLGINTLLTLARGTIEVLYKPHETKLIAIRETCHVALIVGCGIIPIVCSS